MNGTQLLVGGLIAAALLLVPLALLVVVMCRPANRTRFAAAAWTFPLLLLLVSAGAWLWVVFANVGVTVQLHGARDLTLAVFAVIGIYMVWLVAPVTALTWTLLKLRHATRSDP